MKHQAAGWLLQDRAPSLRVLDLTEVARARDQWRRCRQIRAHFHVPVFWDGDPLLGSGHPLGRALKDAGFIATSRGLRLRR